MRIVLVMMVVTMIVACGEAAPEPPANEAKAPPVAASPGPCSLITAEEMTAVIGPLSGPPYLAYGTTPNAAGDVCRFESVDLRSVVLSVQWQDGAQTIALMNTVSGMLASGGVDHLKLIEGTPLTGEWDEARSSGCCEFAALRGDQLVTVNVAGTNKTLANAAMLANIAIGRLDQPLAYDDRAAVAAARAREASRPQPRSVCDLVSRADADAIGATAMTTDPVGDNTSCVYEVPLNNDGVTLSITLNVQWRDGFRDMQTIQDTVGKATAGIGLADADADKADPGPWDEYARSIIGVMAVKRDVLISVEGGPLGQDLATQFIAKAIENL